MGTKTRLASAAVLFIASVLLGVFAALTLGWPSMFIVWPIALSIGFTGAQLVADDLIWKRKGLWWP